MTGFSQAEAIKALLAKTEADYVRPATKWTAKGRRKGGPTAAGQLLARVEYDPNGGCWLWTGAMQEDGYGVHRLGDGHSVVAHRLSYMAFVGPIPDGHLVCHKCDVRACINPAHLFPGTNQENLSDMVSKGRQARGLGHPAAKLTEAQVLEILKSDESNAALGRRYGLHDTTVSQIRRGINWKHLSSVQALSPQEQSNG